MSRAMSRQGKFEPKLCIRNLLHTIMTSKTGACSKNNTHHRVAMPAFIVLARAPVFIAIFVFITKSNA